MERKQKRSITMLVCCQDGTIWTEIYILVYSISKKPSLKEGFYLLILNLQIPYNMDLSIKMRF
jgi:hypothetical protein